EYLKYTQEQVDILWGIVKQAKAKQPLDKELDFTCNGYLRKGQKSSQNGQNRAQNGKSFSARDLWKFCNEYGNIMDAFIPFKKSKAGLFASILKLGKTNTDTSNEALLSLVIDDSCISDIDYSLSLEGKKESGDSYKEDDLKCPPAFTLKMVNIEEVPNKDESTEKRQLWDYILLLIDRWDGECVIMGDFNEVCTKQEMFGSLFHLQCANDFNNFISLASLNDIPLDGYAYTWAHKSITKMSKLDRFLISKGFM
ncbi:RNA-directed DNA polymerase, eukaryota, partial [Tanacetum coccineum]